MWDVWNLTNEGKISRKTLSLMECMDICFSDRNIENLADKRLPKSLDVIYIYRNQHAGRQVQKLFKLDITKERLIMHTHIFNRQRNEQSVEKTDATKHMFWTDDTNKFTISQQLMNKYMSTFCYCQCDLCFLCKECLGNNGNSSDLPQIIMSATRTISLNRKENINYSMKKREYAVKDLPRISKKEINLNELKTKYDAKINKKQKKRSKAKTVSRDVRNCMDINQTAQKSQKTIIKKKENGRGIALKKKQS